MRKQAVQMGYEYEVGDIVKLLKDDAAEQREAELP